MSPEGAITCDDVINIFERSHVNKDFMHKNHVEIA